MVPALSHTPALALDPKRIAANSLTIALHVVALMLLLAPTEAPPAPPAPPAKERVTLIIDAPKRKPPPPLPPLPIQPIVRKPTTPTPVVVPAAMEPVTDTPAPIDEGLPPAIDNPPTPTSFDASGPAFVQLQTDVAPPPPYPAMALRRGLQGTVVLRVLVDSNGLPLQVSIERSSGSRLLDEAAQKFIQARWRFVPAMVGDTRVEAYALVPVNFSIER